MQLQRYSVFFFVSSNDKGTDKGRKRRKTRGKESEEREYSVWFSHRNSARMNNKERTGKIQEAEERSIEHS